MSQPPTTIQGRECEHAEITLPFLHSLDLSFTSSSNFRMLNSVKIPPLQKLTIRCT
jgi:hypothetical protein